MNGVKVLPVEQFYIRLDPSYRPGDPLREQAALEMWRQYALAHGWSIAEEPTIEEGRVAPTWFVIGMVVRTEETVKLNMAAVQRVGALRVPR